MNSVLLTVALLAQQPDRNALEEAREQEARVRALRKAHLQEASVRAALGRTPGLDAILDTLRDANARHEEEFQGLLFSLLRHPDGEVRTIICQRIIRDYPQTPLGRFLRLGVLP